MQPSDFVSPSGGARITATDIAAAAAAVGLSPAHVAAVLEVESAGRGFDPDSHRPVILYEPHVFSRLTGHRFDATHPDVSYRSWGARPYPPWQTGRYAQLYTALALDEAAALSAASWGMFQLMGFNAAACGFAEIEDFVRAMVQGEAQQLQAFVRFLGTQHLLDVLRTGQWTAFAERWNGRDQAAHDYAGRLAAAFARHQGVPS